MDLEFTAAVEGLSTQTPESLPGLAPGSLVPRLHHVLFGPLWPEAGVYRTVDLNVGVRWTFVREAMAALEFVQLPSIIRPSLTLGGLGGGVAYNLEEFQEIVTRGLAASPISEVLVEESIIGWKEYEMEVMRDCADNAVIVCSIENFDPMGVHTGDSITVAPAQTLSDKEYQRLRDASLAILREIGHVVLQRMQSRGREHARLAHSAAELLAVAQGRADHRA